ncbi:MAG: hypothetical protein A2W33_07715 [Chloroflexi bacterium RBG_16_52_11]|nr:MAG: hypothetical protein A2W33_07715 [Chloroflexi bacterium RBG_16_52_11]
MRNKKEGQNYKYLLGMGGLLVVWILLSITSYYLLVIPRQYLFDFYPRWEGSRAVLAGENPYSPEVSWRIQETVFGRRQESYEVVQHFVYPATLTWILLPFWVLPYPLAISLWLGLQLLLLLISMLLVTVLLQWKLSSFTFFLLLFLSIIVYRYPINAYVLGQFIPFVFVSLIISWWGMVKRKPVITFLGLIGMLVRPEVIIIPIIVLLIDNWLEGKRSIIAAWSVSVILLWLLTRLWIGPWELDFLRGIISYTGYSFMQWPPLALGNKWLAVVLACGVFGWGGWMLWNMRLLPTRERLPWEISVSVLLTLIIIPQPNTYTLILALVALWVTYWASEGSFTDRFVLTLILISPWAFFVFKDSVPPGMEQLLIPLMIAALLTRRWILRMGPKQERV